MKEIKLTNKSQEIQETITLTFEDIKALKSLVEKNNSYYRNDSYLIEKYGNNTSELEALRYTIKELKSNYHKFNRLLVSGPYVASPGYMDDTRALSDIESHSIWQCIYRHPILSTFIFIIVSLSILGLVIGKDMSFNEQPHKQYDYKITIQQ